MNLRERLRESMLVVLATVTSGGGGGIGLMYWPLAKLNRLTVPAPLWQFAGIAGAEQKMSLGAISFYVMVDQDERIRDWDILRPKSDEGDDESSANRGPSQRVSQRDIAMMKIPSPSAVPVEEELKAYKCLLGEMRKSNANFIIVSRVLSVFTISAKPCKDQLDPRRGKLSPEKTQVMEIPSIRHCNSQIPLAMNKNRIMDQISCRAGGDERGNGRHRKEAYTNRNTRLTGVSKRCNNVEVGIVRVVK